jgi:hypothetical protein
MSPADDTQNSKDINIQVGGDATLEGVAIGDRNKIISQVQAQGHVVQADYSQVHIGDIYYYFEIPKTEVIHKDPYKFLSTYGLEDEDIFFGRTAAIEELSSLILSQKFVIVNGKSGSGKSSLIHAGVTPRLLRNNHLVIHVKEYLTSPLDTIQAAISGGLESSLVIFLDQFERFFIYLPLEERLRFSTALKGWLDDTTSNVRFVVAIRMDFFGRIGEFQKVIRDIYQQSAIFTLEPLTRDEAREAIEGPLEEMGIRIVYDEALITVLLDRLLEDAEIEPAQLQIVCDELYRHAKDQNIKILKEDGIYQELGGVEGMLKSYLQRKLKEYMPQDEAVKRVLKQMIAPVEVSAGIRTFVEAPQIATRLNVPEDDIAPLIERLVDDRLIEKKETDGQATYSLAHEYMAGQVQEWFDPKETAFRRAKDILTHAMSYNVLMQYEEASQVKEYEQELKLTAEEQIFLKKSLNKHYRWVWFRRGLVTAITVFALIATGLG